jgi:hypothetical protein
MQTCAPTHTKNTKLYSKIKILSLYIRNLENKYEKYKYDVSHVLPSPSIYSNFELKMLHANHLNNK